MKDSSTTLRSAQNDKEEVAFPPSLFPTRLVMPLRRTPQIALALCQTHFPMTQNTPHIRDVRGYLNIDFQSNASCGICWRGERFFVGAASSE